METLAAPRARIGGRLLTGPTLLNPGPNTSTRVRNVSDLVTQISGDAACASQSSVAANQSWVRARPSASEILGSQPSSV